jgi:hypothetical protein
MPDIQEELPSTTDLEYAFLDISHVITCLYRFSVTLRQPTPRDRFHKYAAIDVSHFEPFDIQHVRNKFPQAQKYLSERMGKANTRRRQLLRYHKKHHDKIARFIDASPIPEGSLVPKGELLVANQRETPLPENRATDASPHDQSLSRRGPATIATTLNSQTTVTTFKGQNQYLMDTADVESEAGQSQTTISISGDNGGKLSVPPPPHGAALDETPFECPYCYVIIKVKSTYSWM